MENQIQNIAEVIELSNDQLSEIEGGGETSDFIWYCIGSFLHGAYVMGYSARGNPHF
jgi:bacteriocin-like protein